MSYDRRYTQKEIDLIKANMVNRTLLAIAILAFVLIKYSKYLADIF